MICRRCEHPRDAHRHYRPGSDCGRCDCPRYRRRWRPLTGLLAGLSNPPT